MKASPSSGAAAFGGEGMQRANSFHYENKVIYRHTRMAGDEAGIERSALRFAVKYALLQRLAGASAMARVQESGDEVRPQKHQEYEAGISL